MLLTVPTRRFLRSAVAALVLLPWAASFAKQPAKPAPSVKPPAQRQTGGGPKSTVGPKQNQEHLAEWMDRHRSLPLAQQQSALQNEPGFRQLPAQTQQRMLDRLTQLNSMPEEQRRRILERNEAMESLTPQQRKQVREALGQLSGLPVERRRLVARAFRDLREMPDQQRQAILTSDRIKGQFSDQERTTLSNLLSVEPYLPVQNPSNTVNAGK